MRSLTPTLLLLATLATTANHASAAFFGWTSSQFATDGSLDGTTVVQKSGTYVLAWNAGNGADVTVNDVLFVNNPDDDTDVDITITGNSVTSGNAGEFTGSFQTLMSTIEYNGDAGSPSFRSWTMRLEGLTEDTKYRVQFLSHQAGLGASSNRQMQIYFGSDTSGPSTGVFDARELSGSDADAWSWTAVFTATGSVQDFYVNGASGQVPIVNAVSIFAIPAPSAALSGLALLGLAAARRRRK